jgi:hypothetical protein
LLEEVDDGPTEAESLNSRSRSTDCTGVAICGQRRVDGTLLGEFCGRGMRWLTVRNGREVYMGYALLNVLMLAAGGWSDGPMTVKRSRG